MKNISNHFNDTLYFSNNENGTKYLQAKTPEAGTSCNFLTLLLQASTLEGKRTNH